MDEWIAPSEAEREEMRRADEAVAQARPGEEGRRHPRVNLAANVTSESEDNFFMGLSENISEGGVFVASFSPPARGEKVKLRLTVEGHGEVVVSGVVRWLRVDGDGQETGCGVEFEALTAEQEAALRDLLASVHREPLLSAF